jgi:peptide/nickel transport system substrate-binding protein
MLSRALSTAAAVLCAIPLLSGQSFAGKADDTLVWSSAEEPPDYDFYFNESREGTLLANHIWDTLLIQDLKKGEFKPHLAETFTWVDPQTIDVTLRKGIKFHNGEPFNADDVVYTINWTVDPANKIRASQKVDFIKSAEKTGEYSVRIHLKGPFPAAMTFFSVSVPIYPNEYYAKVGPAGMSAHPIGTGPYKVESVEKGKQLVLVRNEDYFGGAREKAKIGKLIFRPIRERTTQIAELMTGGVDWIWNITPDQAASLKANPDLTVVASESIRIGFLKFDAAGVTGDTPFKKLEVRQAVSYAIDRDAIVKNLVGQGSRVIHAPCFPEQFACEDKLAKRYTYDPKLAKDLMVKAGYANGFSTDFYACRDKPYVEAIINYLAAINIKTNLKWQTCSKLQELTDKGETAFSFYALGSGGVMDVSIRTSKDWDGGTFDYAKDPEVTKLFLDADLQIDQEKRKEMIAQGVKLVTEKAYWLPLFTYATFYAYTKDLNFTPTSDETPRFSDASWK